MEAKCQILLNISYLWLCCYKDATIKRFLQFTLLNISFPVEKKLAQFLCSLFSSKLNPSTSAARMTPKFV